MPELNQNNFLNLAGFILVTFLTLEADGGPDSWFGEMQGIDELARRYDSILSPAEYAVSAIQGLSLMFQGIFVVLQMMPTYRANNMVQDGVKFYYAIACLAQVFWAWTFGRDWITASFIIMAGIFATFAFILKSQDRAFSDMSPEEFWLLRFPFSITTAWVFFATLLNFDAMLAEFEVSDTTHLVWAMVSIAIMVAVAGFVLFKAPFAPCYVTPAVFAWLIFAMARGEEEYGWAVTIILYVVAFGLAGGTVFIAHKNEIKSAQPAEIESTYEGAKIDAEPTTGEKV